MFRRTFFKSVLSSLVLQCVPKWAQARSNPQQETLRPSIYELALVVLPSALGSTRMSQISADFEKWIHEYPSGADAGYTYGNSKLRVLGPNPSSGYTDQIDHIAAAASAEGKTFSQLDAAQKRAIIRSVLADLHVTSVPPRPNGLHVVTDLMSFFYNSSDGNDFCYQVAIRRSDCRGLASSGKRPPSLT